MESIKAMKAIESLVVAIAPTTIHLATPFILFIPVIAVIPFIANIPVIPCP
ncbi:MAG: hypothetical protein J6333_04070 [Planctomycetes bacterium]|nr:hypothetical protein [Planctomycetota bacterium]